MMGWYGGPWAWGGWLVMSLMMVAFWAFVIWAVVMLVRGGRGHETWAGGGAGRRTPMQILDERFARGEIDDEEYRARRSALRDMQG